MNMMEFRALSDIPARALYEQDEIAQVRKVPVGPDQFLGASGTKVRITAPPITEVLLENGEWDIWFQVAVLWPTGEQSDTMAESWLKKITPE